MLGRDPVHSTQYGRQQFQYLDQGDSAEFASIFTSRRLDDGNLHDGRFNSNLTMGLPQTRFHSKHLLVCLHVSM